MKMINAIILAAAAATTAQAALADHALKDATYSITITNITKGMLLTPFLAAVHDSDIALFTLGAPASDELARIAESGNTGPQANLLKASADVFAVSTASMPLMPGQSVSMEITAPRQLTKYRLLSMAAMMVPSNDTFASLNSVKMPLVGSVTYYAKSYDAGSEINDELCTHVPGPFCGGEGYSPGSDGEGFVYPSPATHGEGDLSAATYRWSDPVAKITITRTY